MKKVHPVAWYIVTFGLLGIIYNGFRLVTQAGQAALIIQNDGYAVTGGVMILLGSVLLTWWWTKKPENLKNSNKGGKNGKK